MNQYHTAMRKRRYTFHEMLGFAEFFAENRNSAPPENLLNDYFGLKTASEVGTKSLKIVSFIESTVAKYYGLPIMSIRSKRQYGEFVRARMVICYLAVKYVTQQTISMALGGFSRNNVQYMKTKCALLMETEPDLVHEVEDVFNVIDPVAKMIKRQMGNDETDVENGNNT